MAVTPKQQASIDLYSKLMEEAKLRMNGIQMALAGSTILANPLVREFCFLQLRMLCELTALGCLVAHGDINETTKLKNEWAADRIMKSLETLHPHFYPQPCLQRTDGDGIFNVTPLKGGFLTKPELLRMYGACGNSLHRGSLKKLLGPNTPDDKKNSDIIEWGKKLNTLLRFHSIFLRSGNVIICTLSAANFGGRVQVAWAEAMPDGPPQ